MATLVLAGCAGGGTITLPAFDRSEIAREYPAIKLYRAPEIPEPAAAGPKGSWLTDANTMIPAGGTVKVELDDGMGPKIVEHVLGVDGAVEPYPGVRTRVAGCYLFEAQRDVERDLKRFIRNPRVKLAVLSAEKHAEPEKAGYDVCGRVKDAKAVTSSIPLRASLALSRAGGFDGDVAVNQILVLRYAGGSLDRVIACDFIRIVEGGPRGEDLWLESGDVVFAPGLEGPPWDLIAEAAAGRLDRAGLIRALNAR